MGSATPPTVTNNDYTLVTIASAKTGECQASGSVVNSICQGSRPIAGKSFDSASQQCNEVMPGEYARTRMPECWLPKQCSASLINATNTEQQDYLNDMDGRTNRWIGRTSIQMDKWTACVSLVAQ